MNLATIPQPQATPSRMSSREVAELTGKNHADVMRDIRGMVATLQKAEMLFVCESSSYLGENNQSYPMYNMDKETTICLLTGYDAVARMKVIQRWQALEAMRSELSIPKTLSQALLLAAQQAEQVELLQLQVAEAQPAKEFYAAVTDSRDAIPVSDAAKVLGIEGIGQNKLFIWMREKRLLMSDQKHWNMPYQEYIERGYFRVVEQKYVDGRGETHISLKTLVLQKGLQYISKALSPSL
ncbi:MAG: hypothetical protein NVS3B25_34770 [Hymenobacter sp.]